MKKNVQIMAVLLVAALVIWVAWRITASGRQEKHPNNSVEAAPSMNQKAAGSVAAGSGRAVDLLPEGAPTRAAALRQAAQEAAQSAAAAVGKPVIRDGGDEALTESDSDASATPQERAVMAWDKLIDALSEESDEGAPALPTPTYELMQQVRSAFYRMDPEDRADNMQHTLNLLPDEQFTSLYAILFDKNIDPDILDDIFSDALNRADEIKVPLMKELMKDKEHPCHEEAVRILEATGELDEAEA